MINQSFIDKFQIPEVAYPFINQIFHKDEIDFVTKLKRQIFTISDVEALGIKRAVDFIKRCYQRGIISIVSEEEGIYKVSDFYGRLDIFSISETNTYRSFPKKDRVALDQWYFDTYYDGLTKEPEVRPTSDEILPLEQVINFIDQQDREVYLNYCDCRSLGGDCGLPTKTCITYRDGINSFAHRGLSEKITKERAKEIVIQADKSRLMHTVNPNGVCNCCGDCCYLFRAQERRNSEGFWPKTDRVIELDNNKCIACGKCIKTCHFKVFQKNGIIVADQTRCIGCGICVQPCPVNAITLINRAPVNKSV